MKMKFSVLLFVLFFFIKTKAAECWISGNVNGFYSDTLYLGYIVNDNFILSKGVQLFSSIENDRFSFRVPLQKTPALINIYSKDFRRILYSYVVEDGDSIDLIFKSERSIHATGKGSEKWMIRQKLDQISDGLSQRFPFPDISGVYSLNWGVIYDSLRKELAKIRDTISDHSALLLKSTTFALLANVRLAFLSSAYTTGKLSQVTVMEQEVSGIENVIRLLETDSTTMVLLQDFNYADMLFSLGRCRIMLSKMGRSWEGVVDVLDSLYPGRVSEAVIMRYLYRNKNFPNYMDKLSSIVKRAKLEEGKGILLEILDTYKKNEQLKYASFVNAEDREVHLNNLTGKVLLLDFWYTGCVPCRQMKVVLDKVKDSIVDNDFVIVSISVDKKPIWLSSLKTNIYTRDDNLNLYVGRIGLKHRFLQYYNVVGYPFLLLLDRNGRIAGHVSDPRKSPAMFNDFIFQIRSLLNLKVKNNM